jgi:hypothetical protein
MGSAFVPFRRRVHYARAREAVLETLRERLERCARPDRSIALLRGHPALAPIGLATIGVCDGKLVEVDAA